MQRQSQVVIIMGSKSDFEFCKKIGQVLESFGVDHLYRVASAHKTPQKVLQILEQDTDDVNRIYITVAGRSNALSGFVDSNTTRPVIACPVYSDKFSGVDIFSTLRMPSGSGLMTVLEPEAAALAAIKILATGDSTLRERLQQNQSEQREKIHRADEELTGYGKR